LGLVDWSAPPAPSDPAPAAAEREARRTEQVRAVGDAVDKLAARRVALRRELAAARRPAGQAASAGALADAYGRAREALAKPSQGVAAAVPMRSALSDTESAYRRLASTARARDRRAWRQARRETRRREAQLERVLR
jgi:hypothetical protein